MFKSILVLSVTMAAIFTMDARAALQDPYFKCDGGHGRVIYQGQPCAPGLKQLNAIKAKKTEGKMK